jgi:hypothetical protein
MSGRSALQHGGRLSKDANKRRPEDMLGFAVGLALRSYTSQKLDASVRDTVAMHMQSVDLTTERFSQKLVCTVGRTMPSRKSARPFSNTVSCPPPLLAAVADRRCFPPTCCALERRCTTRSRAR